MNRTLRMIGGAVLITIGIVGLVTPFLQGILLILAGVGMIKGVSLKKTLKLFREKVSH